MIEEYRYQNGKIKTYDDTKEKQKYVSYQDNIEEIFISENIIETYEKELKKIEQEKYDLEKKYKNNKKGIFAPIICMFIISIAIPTLTTLLFCFILNIELAKLNYIKGTNFILDLIKTFCPFFTILGGTISLTRLNDTKKNKKELKAIKTTKEMLEKKLSKEKEKVVKLKQDKKRENEESFKQNPIRTIKDKEYLNEIKNMIKTYYNIGYDEKIYIKKYNNDNITEKERQYVEEYIKQKKKILKK